MAGEGGCPAPKDKAARQRKVDGCRRRACRGCPSRTATDPSEDDARLARPCNVDLGCLSGPQGAVGTQAPQAPTELEAIRCCARRPGALRRNENLIKRGGVPGNRNRARPRAPLAGRGTPPVIRAGGPPPNTRAPVPRPASVEPFNLVLLSMSAVNRCARKSAGLLGRAPGAGDRLRPFTADPGMATGADRAGHRCASFAR
jgi:hypothetical protein